MITLENARGRTILFDEETDGLLDTVSVIHCIGMSFEDGTQRLFGPHEINEALEILSVAGTLIGHNIIGYDIPVINKLYPEWSTKALIRDSLVQSRLVHSDMMLEDEAIYSGHNSDLPRKYWGRHSLAAWGYRLGEHKGEFGATTNWGHYSSEMGEYCLQDVAVTLKLWDALKDYPEQAIDLEHKFVTVLQKQMEHGLHFNVAKAKELHSKLLFKKKKIEGELQAIFPPTITLMKVPEYWIDPCGLFDITYKTKGSAPPSVRKNLIAGPLRVKSVPFNPGSRDQVAAILADTYGWEPTEFTDDTDNPKPKVNDEILATLDYPEIPLFREFLMLKKRLGQLATGPTAWLSLEKNGIIYGRIIHNGTPTGRCRHSGPNLGQVPNLRAEYGYECRELFCVPPGYKLVGADAKQLELRCLAHYTYRWDGGSYVNKVLSDDIHEINQKDAGLETRDQAKTFIYALNYGAGDEKIGNIAGCDKATGKKIKAEFFAKNPGQKTLLKEVELAVARNGCLKGLDGRNIPIRTAHAALNSLLQCAGALIVKLATVLMDEEFTKRGWTSEEVQIVAHIHDEVQIQAKDHLAAEVGQIAEECFRRTTEIFNLDCPMDGESKIGNNWAETH